MGHATKMDFNGDPNIGLYGIATDEFCLLGKSVPAKYIKKIEETLGVPVYQVKLYGTDLIGIFAVATSKGILIPDIVFDYELEALQKLPINFTTIKTTKTALNNNILCNDKVAFVSKDYTKTEVETIKKSLGVNVVPTNIARTNLPGSCGILTNKGAILNSNAMSAEIRVIEKELGFEIGLGTVNRGSNFVGSGIIANSNGFIAGSLTSGSELMRVDESLRLLE
jgi:translation initiation factor 6